MPLVDCNLHISSFCSEMLLNLSKSVSLVYLSLDTVLLPLKLP